MKLVKNGLRISILSTSKGADVGQRRAHVNVGGEILRRGSQLRKVIPRIGKKPIAVTAGVTSNSTARQSP